MAYTGVLDTSVRRKMAEGPGTVARWGSGRKDSRDAARRRHQSTAGQSVPALCIHGMDRYDPGIPFERYADDAVVHCRSKEEAQRLKQGIAARMEECGLERHPKKTKIVYCKDDNRTGCYPVVSFDFLGYCFRARLSRNRQGKYCVNFSPAIAPKARKSIYAKIRDWRIPRRSETSIKALAQMINPVVRGWVGYSGVFYKSSLLFRVHHLERLILKWVKRKYKKQGSHLKRAKRWIKRVKSRYPELFVHWTLLRAN